MRRARLRLALRQCLDDYESRTGRRLTYGELAAQTGLSEATIKSLATRAGYNATLRTIERICKVLKIEPADLIRWE